MEMAGCARVNKKGGCVPPSTEMGIATTVLPQASDECVHFLLGQRPDKQRGTRLLGTWVDNDFRNPLVTC